MRSFIFITSLILLSTNSCLGQESDSSNAKNLELTQNVFVNEHGQVELIQISDTMWQTIFTNNEGFVFDTVMIKADDKDKFKLFNNSEEQFFLKYHWGGLSVLKDRINVIELSSYGQLGNQTDMWGMYQDPFFKLNQTITLKGDIQGSKGLKTIAGIYLIDNKLRSGQYYELEGNIIKEKWPSAYYSTDETPQGIFGNDTSLAYYRLVMKSPKDVTPEMREFKGSTINISTGEASISWEFADSEAYILDGHEPWTTEEELKDIIVEGVLIQNEQGSVLKNWRIISE